MHTQRPATRCPADSIAAPDMPSSRNQLPITRRRGRRTTWTPVLRQVLANTDRAGDQELIEKKRHLLTDPIEYLFPCISSVSESGDTVRATYVMAATNREL